MRSINNIVDATNFVMLDLGNPLHAFDRREVRGDAIRVRRASAAEVFETTLAPGEEWTQLAVFSPPKGTPSALVRTSAPSLWTGASADRLQGFATSETRIPFAAKQLSGTQPSWSFSPVRTQ